MPKPDAARASNVRTRASSSTKRLSSTTAATTPSSLKKPQLTGTSGAAAPGSFSGLSSVFAFRFAVDANATPSGKAPNADPAGGGPKGSEPSSHASQTSVVSSSRGVPLASSAASSATKPATHPEPVANDSSHARSASARSSRSASSQLTAGPKLDKGKAKARESGSPEPTNIFPARSRSLDSQSSGTCYV